VFFLLFSGVLLTGGLVIWLHAAFKISIHDTSLGACKMFSFLIYTVLDFSVLIIVIMTAEKLYAVLQPIKVHQAKFNKKKSTIYLISAFIFCALINSHFVFTYSLMNVNQTLRNTLSEHSFNKTFGFVKKRYNVSQELETICSFTRWDSFYNYYWAYIDASIYSFIPFISLSSFNVLIVQKLKKANELRANILQIYHKSNAIASQICSMNSLKKKKRNRNFDGNHCDPNNNNGIGHDYIQNRSISCLYTSKNSINIDRQIRKNTEGLTDINAEKLDIIVKSDQRNSNPYRSYCESTLSIINKD
jgi:hypothetical protein